MAVTHTKIAWCDSVWNPLRGCSRVSDGCRFCYAERQAGRFSAPGYPYEGLVRKTSKGWTWTGEVRFIEKDLTLPLRWKKPRRIFVASMSDPFHEAVPDEWLDQMFAVMALAPQHVFQVLTKRPARMHAYFGAHHREFPWGRINEAALRLQRGRVHHDARIPFPAMRPLPNVWLGCSVENQSTADERIPWLLRTPAAVRFLSAEPLLQHVLMRWWLEGNDSSGHRPDWVVCGGESGPKARPCNLAWLRGVVQQCHAAGVACFVKQLGSNPYEEYPPHHGRSLPWPFFITLKDRKGAAIEEWPAELRVQQWPRGA